MSPRQTPLPTDGLLDDEMRKVSLEGVTSVWSVEVIRIREGVVSVWPKSATVPLLALACSIKRSRPDSNRRSRP